MIIITLQRASDKNKIVQSTDITKFYSTPEALIHKNKNIDFNPIKFFSIYVTHTHRLNLVCNLQSDFQIVVHS